MTDEEELRDAAYARVLAIEAAADSEVLLSRGGAWEAMLERARDEALDALGLLISMDFRNLKQVREQQWRVTRYESLCRWIRDIEVMGESANSDMSEDEAFVVDHLLNRGETEPQDA
jgi:hypothetical protein